MNVGRPQFGHPRLMGETIWDSIGHGFASAGRTAADLWNRATQPTVVATPVPDNTPLYLGLAGIALVGAVIVMKPKRKRSYR